MYISFYLISPLCPLLQVTMEIVSNRKFKNIHVLMIIFLNKNPIAWSESRNIFKSQKWHLYLMRKEENNNHMLNFSLLITTVQNIIFFWLTAFFHWRVLKLESLKFFVLPIQIISVRTNFLRHSDIEISWVS